MSDAQDHALPLALVWRRLAPALSIVVVNAAPGSKLRDRFMASVLGQDDDKYVAYWTVRRHVGKGTPPRDLRSAAEVIEFVQSTPGALGYVSAGDLLPGLNVVLRAQP